MSLVDRVKGWVLARKPDVSDIDMDLDLIDTRVLDSLMFVEFIVFLERLIGRELEPAILTADSFRTLRRIGDRILTLRE